MINVLEYLKNIPEEKQEIVIQECYDDLCKLYNTTSDIAKIMFNADLEEHNKHTKSWKCFKDIVKNIELYQEKMKETCDIVDVMTYEQVSAEDILGVNIEIFKSKNHIGAYEDFGNILIDNIPKLGKKNRNQDETIPFIIALDIYINHKHDWPNKDLEARLYNTLISRISNGHKKNPIGIIRKSINLCNTIKNIEDPDGMIESKLDSINYIEELLRVGLLYYKTKPKTENIKRGLKKLDKKIRKAVNHKSVVEQSQGDIIKRNYKDFFRKLTKLTEEERGIKNVEFIRDSAEHFDSFEEPVYRKMNELTGIEYNLLFHIVEQKRQLKQSEKDIFSSITGEEYI